MIVDIRRSIAALNEDDIVRLIVEQEAVRVPQVPWWQWVVELAGVLKPDDTIERCKRLEVD